MTEVAEFFTDRGVHTTPTTRDSHCCCTTRAIVVDGRRAILMGSPLKQYYFSDTSHAIRDARPGARSCTT